MQERFNILIRDILAGIPEGPVLLAVSGGPDSMCMAELFRCWGQVPFAVAHCNFHLRGDESDGDERLVREWSEACGAVFHKKDFDTLGYVTGNDVSVEMAAREQRYGWFLSLCREYGYAAVAVAHNANDNAETLFLNLLRGTGMKGITGMRRISRIPVAGAGENDLLIRPMLGFERDEITAFAERNAVSYRTDSTNAKNDCRRNVIRNKVFPLLKELNPSFVSTLNADMGHFADAAAVTDDWFREWNDKVTEGDEILADKLAAAPHREYLLYRIMSGRGFGGPVIRDVSGLVFSCDGTFSGRKFFSDRHVLVSSRGRLRFVPRDASADTVPLPVQVAGAGIYDAGPCGICVETFPYDGGMSLRMPPGMVAFDAERLPFPFIVRLWKAGDWFRPFGMKGRKKLSDFFTDLGVPVTVKEKTVVLVASAEESHVAAVPGFGRIDDGLKVTASTGRVVTVRIV